MSMAFNILEKKENKEEIVKNKEEGERERAQNDEEDLLLLPLNHPLLRAKKVKRKFRFF